MPLTTTATWPTLSEGRKAKASEVEAKFDWLEGDQLPMSGGNFTTGVYNIGSSLYKWGTGYFNSLIIGGVTLTADTINGTPIRGWARVTVSGSTITASSVYNISSIVRNGTGDYTLSWDIDFASANYACIVSPISNTVRATSINAQAASYVQVLTFPNTSTAVDCDFNLAATGVQ